MFKSLTQRASERLEGVDAGIDPSVVARAFGFGGVEQPNEPLRESGLPISRSNSGESETLPTLLLDQTARRPEPHATVLELVSARILSLEKIAPKRKKQLVEILESIIEPLQGVDDFIAGIEEERFVRIEQRWETIRLKGRAILESIPTLQGEVYTRLSKVNEAEEVKTRKKSELESAHLQRRTLERSTFSAPKEIEAAAKKEAKAKDIFYDASQAALEAHQFMAEAEGAWKTAQANLQTHEQELHRLNAELSGAAYFDPATGLSQRPEEYKGTWQ